MITLSVLDATTITLIGGVALSIITALVTGIISIITALRTSSRIDAVAKDTEAIKGHVNSEKTASDGRETALRQENVMLRQIITDKSTTAQMLAQAVAQASPVHATPPAAPAIKAPAEQKPL